MNSQVHLPVWAKILLDIPVQEEILTQYSKQQPQGHSSRREASLPEVGTMERSATILRRTDSEWKWRWQNVLRPIPEEASA